jgi:hypothetical protein
MESDPEEATEETPAKEVVLTRDHMLALPVGLLTIGVVLALGATQVSNADLGFHLATGRYVLDTGTIPATNVLSFTEPNHPWLLHEWLSGVIIAKIWSWGGALGLFFGKIALLGLTWSLVFSNARQWGASVPAAGLATVLCSWAAASRFIFRPQLFSNLALAGGLWLISRWLQDPTSPKTKARSIKIGVILVLAYQLHAGAITLFITLLIIAVAVAAEPVLTSFGRDAQAAASGRQMAMRPAAIGLIGVAITALLLTIYHPHGAKILLVPLQLGTNDALRHHIIEFRPAWAFPLALTFPFWIMLVLTFLSTVSSYRHKPLALAFPALVFAGLALRHQRAVDTFAVLAAPLIAVAMTKLIKSWRELEPLALLTLIAVALGAPLHHWRYYPVGPGINPAVWPQAMFSWIKKEKLTGPAFISDGWAGPFLAEFFPKEKSFFDPRLEAYSPQHYLGVYRRIRYGQPGWDKLLDDFGIQLIVLKYTSPGEARNQKGQPNVRQHLLGDPTWSLIAFDQRGEIFVRRGGVNGSQAKRYNLSCFDPDRGVFTARPASCAKPLMELIKRGFGDNHVLLAAAIAHADLGLFNIAQQLVDRAREQQPDDERVKYVHQDLRLIAQSAAAPPGSASAAPPPGSASAAPAME